MEGTWGPTRGRPPSSQTLTDIKGGTRSMSSKECRCTLVSPEKEPFISFVSLCHKVVLSDLYSTIRRSSLLQSWQVTMCVQMPNVHSLHLFHNVNVSKPSSKFPLQIFILAKIFCSGARQAFYPVSALFK